MCGIQLCSCFPVRTKLNYNPPKQDGSTYRIELQGISMAIMKQILDYIFSGEVSVEALFLGAASPSVFSLSILIYCCMYSFGLCFLTVLCLTTCMCVSVLSHTDHFE